MAVNMKFFEDNRYRNVDGILQVVKDGLCHRCGACIGVCPVDTFGLAWNGYPTKVADCIYCNICVQTCSGLEVDYNAIGKRLFGEDYTYERDGRMGGIVNSAYVAYAVDSEIRNGGASGGVVTQIFDYMLESGMIKGAIVVIEDPDQPARGIGIVARNRKQLIESQQSRYTTSPHLHVLSEIKDEDGPFALVALPCQIHSLRKRQAVDPRWKARIPYVIGLLCHFSLPMEATLDAEKILAPKGTRLRHAKYRQKDFGGWPGNTLELTFTDGSKWRSPFGPAQTFNVISRVAKLGRCLQCLDAAAEFADLSVGDPWIRDRNGNWKYEEPEGWSAVLVRTSTGADIIDSIIKSGKLEAVSIPVEEVEQGQRQMIQEKKKQAVFRISVRKTIGMKTPKYSMDFPKIDLMTKLEEIIFWILRLITVFGFVRRFLLKIGFSPIGQYFVKRRMDKRKKKASMLKSITRG